MDGGRGEGVGGMDEWDHQDSMCTNNTPASNLSIMDTVDKPEK